MRSLLVLFFQLVAELSCNNFSTGQQYISQLQSKLPLFSLHYSYIIILTNSVMGTLPSKQSSSQSLNLSHPSLKNPCLLSLEGQQYLRVTCGAEEVQYQRWMNTLQRFRKAEPPPRCLLLPVDANFSNHAICSTIGTVEVFYEKYCNLLSEDLYHRIARHTPYTESQIWLFLLVLVKAERQAQVCGQILGDVRPQNIFLNEKRELRLGGRCSWPAGSTAFEKGVDRMPAFVSPEDMEALSIGAIKPSNPITSDIFAMGLTLLSLCNLANYQGLYRMGERRIDLQALTHGLTALKSRYAFSQVLRCIICNLCSCLPTQRMTLEQLWLLLARHQVNIASKKPFSIDNAPAKLHKEMEEFRVFKIDNPMLFASPHLLSEVGGSGLRFPEHLQVHRITPEYVFEENKSIINQLQ